MNPDDIRSFHTRVQKLIADRRLHDVFEALRAKSERRLTWETTARIDELEKTYAYMLKYLADGINDPERDNLYDRLIASASLLLDEMVREMMFAETPTLYYNTLRYQRIRTEETMQSLIAAYTDEIGRLALDINSIGDPSRNTKAEAMARDIFNRVWTAFPFKRDDTEKIRSLLGDCTKPEYDKEMIAGAIWLGMLEFFDANRLLLLIRLYTDTELSMRIRLIALTGIIFALYRYRRHRLPKDVRDAIAAMKEMPEWHGDIRAAYLEILRTRDTESISRKMRDDLFPGLMELGKEIEKKFDKRQQLPDLSNPESMEENPEWDDIMRRNGLHDKLIEMSEIQHEGGDVYMVTFARLKSFPFFNDVANWFLPFYQEHSAVASADRDSRMSDILAGAPFLCDSDKFSMALSIERMPQMPRESTLSQFDRHRDDFNQMVNELEGKSDDARRRSFLNKYLQNVYRFYRLFRRKGEFYDPLSDNINLLEVPALADDFTDEDTLSVVAEFLFKHKYYHDAFISLEKLDSMSSPTPERYQKMGYCAELEGDIATACDFYEQACLLDENSRWTLKRLAITLRKLNRHERAATYWKRLAEQEPENVGLMLNLGYTLIDCGRYAEAAPLFFKADYHDPGNIKAKRGLAWTQLMSRQFKAAADNYASLMTAEPSATDCLNAGHTAWALGNYRDAIQNYKQCMEKDGNGIEGLLKLLDADKAHLQAIGLDISEIPMIIDSILYQDK